MKLPVLISVFVDLLKPENLYVRLFVTRIRHTAVNETDFLYVTVFSREVNLPAFFTSFEVIPDGDIVWCAIRVYYLDAFDVYARVNRLYLQSFEMFIACYFHYIFISLEIYMQFADLLPARFISLRILSVHTA